MAIWRKKRAVRRYEPPSEFPPTPLDELVEEGELIALAGVRLRVKNQIILRTVRDDEPFELDWCVGVVRSEVVALAQESVEDARRLGSRIAEGGRDTFARHDELLARYEPERLPRRQEMLTMLSERLDALATDEARLRQIALSSRDAALDDMVAARVLVTRHSTPASGSAAAARRAAALVQLTADLDALGAALSRSPSPRGRRSPRTQR